MSQTPTRESVIGSLADVVDLSDMALLCLSALCRYFLLPRLCVAEFDYLIPKALDSLRLILLQRRQLSMPRVVRNNLSSSSFSLFLSS